MSRKLVLYPPIEEARLQPLREIGTFMVEIELRDGTVAAVKTIIAEEK